MVEFGKCFSNFMISITFFLKSLAVRSMCMLLKISTLEHTHAKRKKLRNIYTTGRRARNISIKTWEIYDFKIKLITFIIYLRINYTIVMDK